MAKKLIAYGAIPQGVEKSLADPNRAAIIRESLGGKLFRIVTSHVPEDALTKHNYASELDVVRYCDKNVSTAEILAALEEHRPDGVLVTFLMNLRDEAIAAKAHEVGVKAFSTWSVGYDHFNLAQLTELGIALYHTPDVLTDAVAVHTMCFITALASNVPRSDGWVKSGQWASDGFSAAQAALCTTDFFNMTIGIVGMGRIGREVLYLLAPYGPNILWTDIDPGVQARAGELDEKYRSLAGARGYAPTVRCVSLDELLEGSDLVSAHVDLNPTSRNLFGAENLSKMKQGAHFVNTARGGVADHGALYDHLASGRLAGAALDVFSQEPPSDEDRRKLLELPNVLTTPHTASDRKQTRLSMWYLAAYALFARMLGYKPTNIANPRVYE